MRNIYAHKTGVIITDVFTIQPWKLAVNAAFTEQQRYALQHKLVSVLVLNTLKVDLMSQKIFSTVRLQNTRNYEKHMQKYL